MSAAGGPTAQTALRQGLSVALINRYLMIKQRGLI